MTAVIPDMDATRPGQVDPSKIFQAIDDWGVTNMFGSPALLRRVCEREFRFPSLRRVISAGAPVPADVLERFAKMLAPGVQIYTPYGATEALPVANIGSDEILGETRKQTAAGAGVCVGRPVDGMAVKIIRISDAAIAQWSDDLALPVGQIGEIVVQGPVVTREYYKRPEATSLAKIAGGDGRIWHRMGDLGAFDEQGRLWFCGRKSHRVITEKETLYTIPCEAVFNAHPQVFRTALVGVGPPGQARPVLCVELKPGLGAIDKEKLQRELRDLSQTQPHVRDIQTFLVHPGFPVDVRHNSKIYREKLAVWAAGRLT
jgi:acyl-CoA synthetase (AMP-forming)/AMP-acid ligase II